MDDEEAAKWREIFSKQNKAENRPEMEKIEERMNRLLEDCERAGFVCRKVSVFEFYVDFAGAEIANVVYVSTEHLFAIQDPKSLVDKIPKRFGIADMALNYILSMKTTSHRLRIQCLNNGFHCETMNNTIFQVGTYESAFVQVRENDQENVTVTGLVPEYRNRAGFQNSRIFKDVQLALIYIGQIIKPSFMETLEETLQKLLDQINAGYIIDRPSIFELHIRKPHNLPCVTVTLVAHDTVSVQDRQFGLDRRFERLFGFQDILMVSMHVEQILSPPTGPGMRSPLDTLQLLHARVQLLEARILG